MKFAVDLLWVRVGKVGGIESYVRNLLEGMSSLKGSFEIKLIVSQDNADSFSYLLNDKRISSVMCPVYSKFVYKRIIWQNLFLSRLLKNENIALCFEPVYSKPLINPYGIKFITTIHDLQALHYPEYHPKFKNIWMRLCWWNSVRSSEKIIAISEFVRQDIIKHYKCNPDKIIKIYNPIKISEKHIEFEEIKSKYNIEKQKYYYTVSSLLPHKNLLVIIKAISEIHKQKMDMSYKLLISGVGGYEKEKITKMIRRENLDNKIYLTGFLSDVERNVLYENCCAFLFPSIFEGFGMPLIEAFSHGCLVITTKESCIYEVTKGLAIYVDNPFDVHEWVNKIKQIKNYHSKIVNFKEYQINNVSAEYLNVIHKIVNGQN